MAKNIVICCDGTGNKFCNNNTNVIKLYSALDLSDPSRQIAYYHGGLGTVAARGAITHIGQWWTKVIGLAFGYGLTSDIGDIYAFLMDNYEAGDRVYLFGFSRGAYTVRAVSGMLQMFGLLRGGDYNLIQYATGMLKQKRQDDEAFQIAGEFKATFARECPSYFVGVWDTVSSVGWIYDPVFIPYTARNPGMRIGRQAVSIDERRCMFRQNLWDPLDGQDIKQAWFSGVHSDIGGGYAEQESGLAKIALEWMMVEARAAGLAINPVAADRVLGITGGMTKPDPAGPIHNSLKGSWLALEVFPHRHYDWDTKRWTWKIPLGVRRTIRRGAIHETVRLRMQAGIGYNPPNLPQNAPSEPWVRWTSAAAAP
jgi:uncharacterized protein (DUF2235 family)